VEPVASHLLLSLRWKFLKSGFAAVNSPQQPAGTWRGTRLEQDVFAVFCSGWRRLPACDLIHTLTLLLLLRHLQLTLQLLAGKSAPPSTAGLLADTVHLLAAGLEEAPQRTRKDLSLKLLVLFSEVAAGVSSGTGVVRADLGDLLVAVAVAAEGLERTIRLLGGSSSSNGSITRMSLHDIQVRGEVLVEVQPTGSGPLRAVSWAHGKWRACICWVGCWLHCSGGCLQSTGSDYRVTHRCCASFSLQRSNDAASRQYAGKGCSPHCVSTPLAAPSSLCMWTIILVHALLLLTPCWHAAHAFLSR
jgi:hypothetical protein